MCTNKILIALLPPGRLPIWLLLTLAMYAPVEIFAQNSSPLASVAKSYEEPSPPKGITGSIQRGFTKMKQWVSPKKESVDPPIDEALSVWHTVEPNVSLYVAAAKAIENNGNVKLAETRFQDALEKKPKEPEVNLEYARFLARHHRLQEAIRYYHVYLKLLPEFKEGEKLSKKFVELPTHAETYNEIGLVLSRGGKLDPAEHWFYLAIQKEPRNKVYRSNLATLLVRKERFPEAVRQFAAVTDQAEAHYNVGYLAANIHHYHIAREQFTLALKMNPDLAEARQWLLYLQSRGRRAEEERIASKYRDEEGIALGWGARGRPSFDHPSLPSEQGFEHRMLAEGHRYGSGHSRMPEQNGHASAQTNPYVQRDASPEYHRRPRRYPSASVALRSDNRREEEQAVDRRQGASSVGQSIRNPYYPAVPSYNNGPLAPRSSTVYP